MSQLAQEQRNAFGNLLPSTWLKVLEVFQKLTYFSQVTVEKCSSERFVCSQRWQASFSSRLERGQRRQQYALDMESDLQS